MSRGYFDVLRHSPVYSEAEKDWYIELMNCTYIWLDSIMDPVIADTLRKYLLELRQEIERTLDKHFIYYLASRVRVRFSMRKKPRYGFFSKKLIFYVEVGRRHKLRKHSVTFYDEVGKITCPKVEVSDCYITIHNDAGGKTSISVHDFLDSVGVQNGINSEVQYVGYTKNPAERPFDRNHRGLSDMMHWASREDEDYDYFIFYNLFKVLTVADGADSMVRFTIANSMIDEIGVKEEGLVLEKVLIKYFGAKPQELNKERESSELNNRLEELAANHRINSITFDLSMERPSELFRFFSRTVEPSDRHHFTCQIGIDGAEIVTPKNFMP